MTAVEIVPTLAERADRILAIVEGAVLDIGAELIAAKREHPGRFMEWVQNELPFSIDRAERFMAITRVFAGADDRVKAALPPTWTAMFELSRLGLPAVAERVESGEITPEMTYRAARALATGSPDPSPPPRRPPRRAAKPGPAPGYDPNTYLEADFLASELIRTPRGDLGEHLEYLLREWLGPEPSEEVD